MMNLWDQNTPRNFWQFQPDPSERELELAVRNAIPILGLNIQPEEIETLLELTLGEGQFGSERWELSQLKRLYYRLKPIIPRSLIDQIKKVSARATNKNFPLNWPVEERFVHFMWEIAHQLLQIQDRGSLEYYPFWPEDSRFSFVLTHDIETAEGQSHVGMVADLEESLGFTSSFNFVPEGYPLDHGLIHELRQRGFEIGIHGLKHDGKLYQSYEQFMQRAERINHYLRELDAVGFRSPFMHRHPEWLQALDIEYDLSFFDTDPYEPMPGGCMSIWPFTLGSFIELPYTLCQDSTLVYVLGENTPRIWLEKLKVIEENQGMALLNTHPDYLVDPRIMDIYTKFLQAVQEKGHYWHALPFDVARWWRRRSEIPSGQETEDMVPQRVTLQSSALEMVEE